MKARTAILVNQSTGYLTVDICNAFAEKYERVILLAGKVNTQARRLSEKVEVINITPYDKSGIIKRFRTWLKGADDIDKFLDNFKEEADILYFTNPPISYRKAASRPGRFAIVEYDIYPDILRNVFCPEFIIQRLGNKKREICKSSQGMITIGEAMKMQLSAYHNIAHISVIHNWSGYDGEIEHIENKDNEFARKLGLVDKFTVMYSGNIGLTHSVETLLDVAARMKEDEDIRFLIIGAGGRKEELQHIANQRNLDNVVFHDFLPADKMKYSFSIASLGVVTLNEKTAHSSVPSKTYNLLSYGIPLLNIAPPHSELGELIEHYECGCSFTDKNPEDIVEFIRHCRNDADYHKFLSENALEASKSFTVENAKLYTEIFK